jgi:class 3 adenylate cyclase
VTAEQAPTFAPLQQSFSPLPLQGRRAAGATQVGQNFTGKGVHEASRIAGLAEGGQILASKQTAAGGRFEMSDPRSMDIRGIAEPIEVVSIGWE